MPIVSPEGDAGLHRNERLKIMPLRIGAEMPSFEGATEWINKQVTPDDLTGAPTLVHFWAMSCYICKDNMPTIAGWKKTYGEQGVRFVAVHMPRQESDTDIDCVKERMAQNQLDEPCAIDNQHEIGERFQTTGYWPYYFLFDADGKMRSRAAGDVGLAQIEKALVRLLAEPEGAVQA
jgi:thiol-disulfide isomerase/thioredoxin